MQAILTRPQRKCRGRPSTDDRTGRQVFEHVAARRHFPPAPAEESRQRLDRSWCRFTLQTLEHVQILSLDDRPGVVPLEELAPVRAERTGERPRRLESVQRLVE